METSLKTHGPREVSKRTGTYLVFHLFCLVVGGPSGSLCGWMSERVVYIIIVVISAITKMTFFLQEHNQLFSITFPSTLIIGYGIKK